MVEAGEGRRFSLLRSIRSRFFLGITAILLPLTVLVVVSYFFLAGSMRSLDAVVIHLFDDLQVISELQRQIRQIPEIYRREANSPNTSIEPLTMLVRDLDMLFDNALSTSTANINDKESLQDAYASWQDLRMVLKEPLSDDSADEQQAIVDTHAFAMLRNIMIFEASVHNTIRSDLYNTLQGQKDSQLIMAALAFFSLLVTCITGALLYLAIFEPLRKMRVSTERIMTGDMEHRVETADTGELGRLAESFNAMTGMLVTNETNIRLHTIHDSLTGLINRREFRVRFDTELERARRYSQPFALLMVDADGFGNVNETYGHVAGDEALRVIAVTLSRGLRPMDIVARFDNDEFSIIMPDIGADDALATAERLRRLINKQEFVIANGTKPIRLTVSIGLVLYPDDGDEIEILMSRVNEALMQAKQAGGNQVSVPVSSTLRNNTDAAKKSQANRP
jgi:diguanylate cyclase (GGDEF)-like protein